MIYITGDTHREFSRIWNLCRHEKTTLDDVIIILGDVGINYYGGRMDTLLKIRLNEYPITFFCIHGNHEMRPESLPAYEVRNWHGGKVMAERHFPNLLFAMDGEIYDFDEMRCLAIGGAYSVDKSWRLEHGKKWFPDEQPSETTKRHVEQVLSANPVDIILSHTCPEKYIPTEAFLSSVDQSLIDRSTEQWLDRIEERIDYRKWYCGHYHITKRIDRMQFLFKEIDELKL